MKKVNVLWIFIGVLFLATACGKEKNIESLPEISSNEEETREDDNDITKEDVKESVISEEQSITMPSETENSEQNKKVLQEVFFKITGISQEWQDGLYIINGLDMSGNKICGVVDEDGMVELIDEYVALYPLADGHMIATTDLSVSTDILSDPFYANNIGIPGKIIDQEGNTVFEPSGDAFQRMYIINQSRIFIISVAPGFDGLNVQWGVIDQYGNWIHNLENFQQSINDRILSRIEMSKDGKTWDFSEGTVLGRVERSEEENTAFVFAAGQFIYWTESNMLMEYENMWTIYNRIDEENLLARMMVDDDWGYYIVNMDGSMQRMHFDLDASISYGGQEYGVSDSLIEYVGKDGDSIMYFQVTAGFDLFFDMYSNDIQIPDNFRGKGKEIKILEKEIFYIITGDDGNKYMAKTDLYGSMKSGPSLLQGDVEEWDYRNYCLIYTDVYAPYEGTAEIDSDIHCVSGSSDDVYTLKNTEVDGIKFLSDNLVAIYWEEDDIRMYLMSDY